MRLMVHLLMVSVISDTEIELDTHIFTATGKTYHIYATLKLKEGWVECNGQTITDPDSPYYGATVPDLNGTTTGTKRFLRGSTTSGATGGSESHQHIWGTVNIDSDVVRDGTGATIGYICYKGSGSVMYAFKESNMTMRTDFRDSKPPYYEVVYIMRIK